MAPDPPQHNPPPRPWLEALLRSAPEGTIVHPPNPFSAWFSVGADAWLLGIEAATVIGLRGFRMAQGGAEAQAETRRMISEKIAALFELQQLAFAGKLGETAPETLRETVAHYRRAVRANRRRLTL